MAVTVTTAVVLAVAAARRKRRSDVALHYEHALKRYIVVLSKSVPFVWRREPTCPHSSKRAYERGRVREGERSLRVGRVKVAGKRPTWMTNDRRVKRSESWLGKRVYTCLRMRAELYATQCGDRSKQVNDDETVEATQWRLGYFTETL
ncbi:unnamed protein product [Hydatigera taeniaeformis]|uniref:Secreted protein n=1 Tax=Hydatigena taeniaeformis TaxID=6205 RepID=A0A0R3WMT5_HYDTA|nr:unnamed protein product [Hydatigera taeniaeformis]